MKTFNVINVFFLTYFEEFFMNPFKIFIITTNDFLYKTHKQLSTTQVTLKTTQSHKFKNYLHLSYGIGYS
jgi:hypothetical protein